MTLSILKLCTRRMLTKKVLALFFTMVLTRDKEINSFTSSAGLNRRTTRTSKRDAESTSGRTRNKVFNSQLSQSIKRDHKIMIMKAVSHTDSNDFKSPEKRGNAHWLSIGYKGLGLAYLAQVVMALNESGPTLFCANIIGGPALAGAISWILSSGKLETIRGGHTSLKLMNGTLILYSITCLTLVALVPQLNKAFGLLYMLTGAFTFLINAKGYTSYSNSIVEETKKILPRIHSANLYAWPKDVPNVLYMVCMVTVIVLKTQVLLQLSTYVSALKSSRLLIASNVSMLAKLTVLGGSLVTLRDAANEKILGNAQFRKLNLFVSYVFGTMAALKLSQVLVAPQVSVPGSAGCVLLVLSTFSCLKNALVP